MAKESFRTVAGRRLLGLTYIVVLFGLLALSVAVYQKAFTKVVLVTLRTDHTGNQLLSASDVKERGVIVGTVRKVKSQGDGAIVTLALEPGRVSQIPSNVSAQILPKTLFGEQYVALQIPEQPARAIKAGDVIAQDRTKGALETEKVLGDILPLLQAVKPAELNATLTAMATALKGRGEKLGQTLVSLDTYLKQFNPHVPELVDNLKKLGEVAVLYNDAAPDIVDTLNNLNVSARTLIEKQAALSTLLSTATDTSKLFKDFLAENEQRLITIVDTTDQIYALLAQYSPEFTCLFAGLNKLQAGAAAAVSGNELHLSAQLDQTNMGAYKPGEQPRLLTGLGPHCFGLPNPVKPFPIPTEFRCLNDGTPLTSDKCARVKTAGESQEALGSPAENVMVKTLIAGTYGTTPDKVPDIATMLAAPSLRGAAVSTK